MLVELIRQHLDPLTLALAIPALVLAVHVVPYLLDPHGLRSVPGPFLAKFSDAWLGWVAAHKHRSETVHRLHQRYGELWCTSQRSHSSS
jgi:benzoate 4-monooxygenase